MFFKNQEQLDIALAIVLSKISLIWWATISDDFHLTKTMLTSLPIQIDKIGSETSKKLVEISTKINYALGNNIIYTKYAGKWMGNYDIKYIRSTTDDG